MTESRSSASQKLNRVFTELKCDHAELKSKYEDALKWQKDATKD